MQYMGSYPGVGACPGHYGIVIPQIIHLSLFYVGVSRGRDCCPSLPKVPRETTARDGTANKR